MVDGKISRMNDENPCIFCRILAHESPASFVFEDDKVCAFLDIQPVTDGHLLVVPRHHAETMQDLPTESAHHMIDVARHVMKGLRATQLRCDGINLFLAEGDAAGQDVGHVHLHVIPRYSGDGFGLRLPAGYGTRPARTRLDRMADEIRAALQSERLPADSAKLGDG